jgi:heterodisulfide reductase subunit A
VILATGHADPSPESLKLLGAGVIPNVLTMAQFERIASSNGPTGGEIKLANGKAPARVAIVHCAGSLTDKGLAYCSGVCCQNAVKAGELVRKKCPGIAVVNIHGRLVFPGARAEAFYHRSREEGTTFRATPEIGSVAVTSGAKGIVVKAAGVDPQTVDMVILSTGMMPAQGTPALAAMLDLDVDSSGFFQPDHLILHATGTTLDGVWAAGSCASPCDAPTAITRGQAAVGDALARLAPGKRLELEVMTAYIDETLCAGCKLCIAVCPYKAINFDAVKKVSAVNEALCRGCGTCAATCPGAAATAKQFSNNQIYAEIEGVIHG